MDYPAVVVIITTTPSSPVKPTANGRYCITSNSDHVLTCSIRRQYCFIIAPWVGRRLVLGAKFAAHVARRVSRDRLVYLALRSQFSAVQYEYKSIYERAGTLSRRPKCNADVTWDDPTAWCSPAWCTSSDQAWATEETISFSPWSYCKVGLLIRYAQRSNYKLLQDAKPNGWRAQQIWITDGEHLSFSEVPSGITQIRRSKSSNNDFTCSEQT
jgi:hypothetical protein